MQVTWKIDRFRAARGAAKLLRLTCDRCKTLFCTYQKDGPGPLKRLYLDRVHESPYLVQEHDKLLHGETVIEHFTCRTCGELLGMYMLYSATAQPHVTHKGENRHAIRLFQATLIEEVIAEEEQEPVS